MRMSSMEGNGAMKGILPAIAGAAVALGAIYVAYTSLSAATGPVYTVTQVREGIWHQPRSWVGRTVLVRALAYPLGTGCPPAMPWCTNIILSDQTSDPSTAPTLVAMAAQPNATVSLLRRIPMMDRLIPDPQQVNWGQLATYRVHLSTVGITPCPAPCMDIQIEGPAP